MRLTTLIGLIVLVCSSSGMAQSFDKQVSAGRAKTTLNAAIFVASNEVVKKSASACREKGKRLNFHLQNPYDLDVLSTHQKGEVYFAKVQATYTCS